MLDKIKRLGSDTAVYGISTIVGRFLNYLLTPFYTNVLLTGEYGIVAYIYALIAFINVIYNYGMESAFFKYYSSDEIGTKRQNFSVPFFAVVVTSAFFTGIIFLFSDQVRALLNIPAGLGSIIPMTAGILAFDAIAIIPFAALRMERRAKTFAFIKLSNIIITVAMNVVLLVVYRQGVTGIFISALTASVCTFLFLLPTIHRHLKLEFNGSLLRALLKFGLPSIPSGLAAAAIQVIDRPILRRLTDDSTVGIYQANYRLGIFMMLVVQMYDYAWRPFYFSTSREPDAKAIFSRVLTYLTLFMAGVFIIVSLFIDDIVKIRFFGHSFIHPSYWSGLGIVPVVLLGYLFLGIATHIQAGIFIEKKTYLMPPITIVAAVVNIVGNLLLIPIAGMIGAAWATFLAYFIMAIVLYVVVQRIYPMSYEFRRIGKIAAATAVIFACFYYIRPPHMEFLYKSALCVIFILLMYAMRFFNPREIIIIRNLFKRVPPGSSKNPPPDVDSAGGLGA